MDTVTKPTESRFSFFKFVLGLPGLALGWYAGMSLLIPLVLICISVWLVRRLRQSAENLFAPAIGIQIGHVGWMMLGAALLGDWSTILIDILIFGFGLTWLWFRPGLWPLIVLTIFQVFSLGVNIWVIVGEPFGTDTHKALVVHIVLRIAALGAMWLAFAEWRSRAKELVVDIA